ncbi:thiolase [Streptosporangium violaceochromogenes]|nr:thiolase [Streptosporangium violaceochromogenes]
MAIAGVAESDLGITGRTPMALQAQAVTRALAEAGLSLSDVDGYCTSDLAGEYAPSVRMAEYLGIRPTYHDTSALGGASFLSQTAHAAQAIRDGRAEVVVVGYARAPRSWNPPVPAAPLYGPGQYERMWGAPFPVTAYALAARRYLHDHGAAPEQLAAVAVAARRWAGLNPAAYRRDPITVDDVLGSRMIADPLHALDCCLVTDGGGAIVLVGEDRARDLPQRPVFILGHGDASTHMNVSSMPDLTRTAAAASGERALREAGVAVGDIDVFQIYDSFTVTVLLTMESLGLCGPGEAGPLVAAGHTAPGGDLPMNTNGGGLSYCHPGEYGIFTIIEAVRQLRGACGDRQVPGAELALAHGTGGELSATSTLILGSNR